MEINYSTAKTIIRIFRIEKRISKKNCNELDAIRPQKNFKSKIFQISRTPKEESLKEIFIQTETKENISKLKTELDPINALNTKEDSNLNFSIKTNENLNINKEIITKIFTNSMHSLALNVNNLPTMPFLKQNDFIFSREETFEFFNLLNIANNYASMVISLSNSCNSNNEHLFNLLNLFNSYNNFS